MARPKKYATAAERQAAYRARYAVITVRLREETVSTLDKLSEIRDIPRNELINQVLYIGLTNYNWHTAPAPVKKLPRANPVDPLEC